MRQTLVMDVDSYSMMSPVDELKRYKAAFRGVTVKDKEEFKNINVIVPISLGQKYHEGAQFDAIMKLINKSFKACAIIIGDTLRRYSPEIFTQVNNKEEAISLAKYQGNIWLDNHFKYIKTLSIPYKIIRWDEWLAHPDFHYYYDAVCKLYDSDKSYKKVVHEVVNEYLLRNNRNGNHEWFNPGVSYFLEESAGLCLWIKVGFSYNVYPRGDNRAIISAYEKLMKPHGYKYRSLPLNLRKL